MSALILFCKAGRAGAYLNAMAYPIGGIRLRIDTLILAWYDMEVQAQEQLREDISNILSEHRSVGVYGKVADFWNHGPRCEDIVGRQKIDNFIERYNYGGNYFDLTGLPKEDAIQVASILIANGVKNIRMFNVRKSKPKLLHEYPDGSDGIEYDWTNIYEIADDFLGFFERKEARRLTLSLGGALLTAAVATIWLYENDYISSKEIPVDFFSFWGSTFSILLTAMYGLKNWVSVVHRRWRRRYGGERRS